MKAWNIEGLRRAVALDFVTDALGVRGVHAEPPKGSRRYAIHNYPSGSSSGTGIVAVETPFGAVLVQGTTLNGVTSLGPVGRGYMGDALEAQADTGLPVLVERGAGCALLGPMPAPTPSPAAPEPANTRRNGIVANTSPWGSRGARSERVRVCRGTRR